MSDDYFRTLIWIIEVLDYRLHLIESKLGLFSSIPKTEEPPKENQLKTNERDSIVHALQQANGIQKDAARLLGITPRMMHYKVTKYGLRSYCRLSVKKDKTDG